MNKEAIEKEIQEKELTAPRVTAADVEAAVAQEHYFTAFDGIAGAAYNEANPYGTLEPFSFGPAGGTESRLTFCVLVLDNGFTVTGESACASPENFDAELGRKIARSKAVDKIWSLLGFRLRDKLSSV